MVVDLQVQTVSDAVVKSEQIILSLKADQIVFASMLQQLLVGRQGAPKAPGRERNVQKIPDAVLDTQFS